MVIVNVRWQWNRPSIVVELFKLLVYPAKCDILDKECYVSQTHDVDFEVVCYLHSKVIYALQKTFQALVFAKSCCQVCRSTKKIS